MYLGQRVAAIVLTLGLSAGLVGCGFHLKGTGPSSVPVAYSKMNIVIPPNSGDLEEKLSLYLTSAGVKLSNSSDAYSLHILDYSPRKLDLSGKLRENIIRLSVTFRIDDAQGNPLTEPRTVMATRSYQYNDETVNTEDQEFNYLSEVLVDDVAQQIARQIASNRLQKLVVQPKTAE